MKVTRYRDTERTYALDIRYRYFQYEAKKCEIRKGLPADQEIIYILNNIENIYKKIKNLNDKKLSNRVLLFKKGVVIPDVNSATKTSTIAFVKNHIRPSLLRNNAGYVLSRTHKYYLLFFCYKKKIKVCAYYIDKNDLVLKISSSYIPMDKNHVYHLMVAYNHIIDISYRYLLIERVPDIRNSILYYYSRTKYEIVKLKEFTVILKQGKHNTTHVVYDMDIIHYNNDALSLYDIPVCPVRNQNTGAYKLKDKMFIEGLSAKVIDVVKSKDIMLMYPDKIAVIYEDPFKITFVFEQQKKKYALSYYINTADSYDYIKHETIFSFIRYILSATDTKIYFILDNSGINLMAKMNKNVYRVSKKDTLCRKIKKT